MEKTRVGKIFTIIICAALIVGVLIHNRFSEKETVLSADNNENMKYDFNQENIENTVNPETNPDSSTIIKQDTYEIEDAAIEKYISDLKEIINTDPSNAESEDTSEDDFTFKLIYIDELYKLDLPGSVYTNMMDEFQKYINERYITDNTIIKKVAILDKTIEIDDINKMLMYAIRLDKGSTADYAYVTIDLTTFEYYIYDIEI